MASSLATLELQRVVAEPEDAPDLTAYGLAEPRIEVGVTTTTGTDARLQIGARTPPGGDLYEAVISALKEIYDPEIPVNIYDLGLIYGVEVDDESDVTVTMTLTTPHCPVAETMPGEVELRAASVPGVRDAEVNLVWDPPWGPDKMTDEARLELGML